MSEYLIHIQHIQASDGAKWDVLFLEITRHALCTLPVPSSWIKWIWATRGILHG